jgi:hypothetical protein
LPEEQQESFIRNLSEHRINCLIGAPAIERLVNSAISTEQLRQAKAHANLLANDLQFDYITFSGIGWVSHKVTHQWPNQS